MRRAHAGPAWTRRLAREASGAYLDYDWRRGELRGLADYGHHALAHEIAQRWLTTVASLYQRESKLVEKYVLQPLPDGVHAGGGGGEYPIQDGFGWTNGVTGRLLHDTPAHPAHAARAGERA